MPELPEVETVRRSLASVISNKEIKAVNILYPKIIDGDSVVFERFILKQYVTSVNRRGKYLLLTLKNGVILSHLRMTGKYFVTATTKPYSKHVHLILTFDDGTVLQYEDTRKFGRFKILSIDEVETYFKQKKIGVEPTLETFPIKMFKQRLKEKTQAIKVVLLGQQIVAGLGNIYVDEVLFKSKIHPLRQADSLTGKEVNRLHKAIIETIASAIAYGGTTIRDYSSLGEKGKFQQQLVVYGQTGKPCPNCGRLIEKIVVGQRGTHICSYCQKLTKKEVE